MSGSRIAAAIAVVALIGAAVAPAAHAADATDVTVTGAANVVITADPTVPNFGGVTLDGVAKSTTATMTAFEVNDSRGTGAGWNVTVQATRFAEHNGTIYAVGGKQLALNSLSMAAPTVAQDGTTSASPTLTSGPYTVDTGSAVKIASAAADTGMGKYDFSSSLLTLSIPSSAYAKTYRSDVTVSVVSGP